jgi:hypothetical protein
MVFSEMSLISTTTQNQDTGPTAIDSVAHRIKMTTTETKLKYVFSAEKFPVQDEDDDEEEETNCHPPDLLPI